MLDIWNQTREQVRPDSGHIIARVVSTWGSSPRRPGSALLIAPDGSFVGSVSGGCIESAVVQKAGEVRASGQPATCTFGVSDETAWSVGLSCGGSVSVYIEPHWANTAGGRLWQEADRLRQADRSMVLITCMGPNHGAWLVDNNGLVCGDVADLPADVLDKAKKKVFLETSETIECGGSSYFLHALPSPAKLIVVGAGHISIVLARLALELDFGVTIIDPRSAFTANLSFGTNKVHVFNGWPDEFFKDFDSYDNLYAALLSHDPKIDDPVFPFLFNNNAKYIGALGGSKTNAKRKARLAEAGFSAEQINRVQTPIGLPIGAETAAEIALSIMAQIIQTKYA